MLFEVSPSETRPVPRRPSSERGGATSRHHFRTLSASCSSSGVVRSVVHPATGSAADVPAADFLSLPVDGESDPVSRDAPTAANPLESPFLSASLPFFIHLLLIGFSSAFQFSRMFSYLFLHHQPPFAAVKAIFIGNRSRIQVYFIFFLTQTRPRRPCSSSLLRSHH